MLTSPEERLDIVDQRDQVIGSATRGEIHQRGLTHRSIHVLVFDGEQSAQLQKRSMLRDEFGGMRDTSCAGHVESRQDYAETAPRELMEELGFAPSEPLEALFKMEPTADNGYDCLLYTSPSPRDATLSRMPSSA